MKAWRGPDCDDPPGNIDIIVGEQGLRSTSSLDHTLNTTSTTLLSKIHLRLKAPSEFSTKDILLVGKVDDVLLHSCELGGQEPLKLIAPACHLVV